MNRNLLSSAPRLAQLIRDNAARPRDYRVQAADGEEPTIFIYDIIGLDFWTGEGVTAKQFAKDLAGLKDAPVIHLRINSPGGDVFEARAMVAAMKGHGAKFVAHVDGLAASAASVIAANADETEMVKGSFNMIHNAWTIALGDRHAMLDAASLLEKVDGTIADDYEKRTKAKRDQVVAWMDAETWFTADEAVEAGLADRVIDAKVKASAWNLSAYRHTPSALAVSTTSDSALSDDEASFCAQMIPHHELAIEMASEALPKIENASLKNMVEQIISSQAGEIALMTTWLSGSEGRKKTEEKLMKTQSEVEAHAHRERRLALLERIPA